MFVLVAKPQLKRISLTVRRDKPHSTSEHARVLVDFCKVNNLFQTLGALHDHACHVHVYSRCHILFLLEGDVWFHEQSGMKIISHSTTPVKRIADSPPPPHYLHMLNAFVGFGIACIRSVHIRAKRNGAVQNNFFAFKLCKRWGKGKEVKEAGLLLPHFLHCLNVKKFFHAARICLASRGMLVT